MNSNELLDLLGSSLTCARADLNRIAAKPEVLKWFVRQEGWDELRNQSNNSNAWAALPQLPTQPAVCGIAVFLNRQATFPFADDAAILPVKWCLQEAAENQLPATLNQCAKTVLDAMRNAPGAADHRTRLNQSWQLDWADRGWRGVDFSDLPMTPESAFAPLTVALRSAITNVALATDFLATGEFQNGTWSVNNDSLPKKIITAFRLGFRRFAVPKSSESTLSRSLSGLPQNAAGGSIQQCALTDSPDPYTGTEAAAEMAGQKPDPSAPLARREAWYDSIHSNSTANEFYHSHLLESAVESAGTILANNGQAGWRPSEMVSIISNSHELVLLAAKVFKPTKCHLIFTKGDQEDMLKRYNDVSQQLLGLGFTPVAHPVRDSAEALGDIARVVADLTRDNGEILIDVTPGRRAMQMAMLQSAQRSDRVLCWWQDTSVTTRRAIPVTNLLPLVWQVTTDRGLIPLCPKAP